MKFHWVHGILSNLWGFVVETPRVTNAPLGLTRLCKGPSSQAGGPQTITHLLCSSMFDCLSRDTSGLRLLSLLVMLQMWLLSSCSPCLLLCTSAFSFFSSCSSLRSRKQAVSSAVVTPVSSVVFRQFFFCALLVHLLSVVVLSGCRAPLRHIPVGADCFGAGSLLLLLRLHHRCCRSVCASAAGFWWRAFSCPWGFASLLLLR